MYRGLKSQKCSAEKQSGPLFSASSDLYVSDQPSTFPAAATALAKDDSKCFVTAKFAYGSMENEPGVVVPAIPPVENAHISLSVGCVPQKKASVRTSYSGPDVISESLPLASLHHRESLRILQEKCQLYASKINQLESELQTSVELHRVTKNELKAESDHMRSERDIMVIDLGKRILDSFDLSVKSNDSWTDVGCEESSADCPTLSPAGDLRAERQNLRLNLFQNSCMCESENSKAIDESRNGHIDGSNRNNIESSINLNIRNAWESSNSREGGVKSCAVDPEAALNKSACTFCTMYGECVHKYLENDDHDRNLLLHQLLAELASVLQEKSEYSEKLNSENKALELRVAHLETSLLQQRNSFTSRKVHGEMFEECSRLRWRVLELEKNTKLSAEKILLEVPVTEDAQSSVEISADPTSPFSVIPSTRKRGYKIRKSINGLQSTGSPTPSSHSSPVPTTSSSFNTSTAAPSSVRSVWSYECDDNIQDIAAPVTEHSAPSHSHSHSECNAASEGSANREIEAILKIQSELQGKLSSLVLDQEKNSQKSVDQKIEHQIRISKQKLKDEIREKINLKEKIAVQLDIEEKEKEQKENEISNCVQMDYLMEKVKQLMHLHDAKECDYRALVRDLEEQVRTLSYQLYFAQGSTQERLADSEVYDPSEGFEGECSGADLYPYPRPGPYRSEGALGGSNSNVNGHSNCNGSTRYSQSPCSFNTLLCSTSFSSTTTSPAASSVSSSPCKRPCAV